MAGSGSDAYSPQTGATSSEPERSSDCSGSQKDGQADQSDSGVINLGFKWGVLIKGYLRVTVGANMFHAARRGGLGLVCSQMTSAAIGQLRRLAAYTE